MGRFYERRVDSVRKNILENIKKWSLITEISDKVTPFKNNFACHEDIGATLRACADDIDGIRIRLGSHVTVESYDYKVVAYFGACRKFGGTFNYKNFVQFLTMMFDILYQVTIIYYNAQKTIQ